MTGSTLGPRFGPTYSLPAQDEARSRWLRNTDLLQHDHPKVRLLALKLTQLKPGAREKAMACHQFVRQMPFGHAGDAATTSSLAVLEAGMGDCFTKSTLFIALLRSIGIAARARVVAMPPGYLRSVNDTAANTIEHVFTEVLLEGRWLGVDSYVVDPDLGLAARVRLINEKRQCGYGVHLKGQVGWDGKSSSFGQFSMDDPAGLPVLDLGAFDDVKQFAASGAAPKRQSLIAATLVNRRIRKIRETVRAAPAMARARSVGG